MNQSGAPPPFGPVIPPTGAPGMPTPMSGGVPKWSLPPGWFAGRGGTRGPGAPGAPSGGPPSKGGGGPSKGGGPPSGGRAAAHFLNPAHPGVTFAFIPDD